MRGGATSVARGVLTAWPASVLELRSRGWWRERRRGRGGGPSGRVGAGRGGGGVRASRVPPGRGAREEGREGGRPAGRGEACWGRPSERAESLRNPAESTEARAAAGGGAGKGVGGGGGEEGWEGQRRGAQERGEGRERGRELGPGEAGCAEAVPSPASLALALPPSLPRSRAAGPR